MGILGALLCGGDQTDGKAKLALTQLSSSIDAFAERALRFLSTPPSDDFRNLGPFCARVLLENSCAALVGRLDCFRLLYLTEFQSQPEYQIGKRIRSGFSWMGDVIPDEKSTQDLWNPDHDIPKISRALFSRHMEHIYWKPAVERMLDFVASQREIATLQELLQIDSENYVGSTKGRCLQLYSTLSKGVHWEFFSSSLLFDDMTVTTMIRDTFLLVGHLGLTSHFIPTAYGSLAPEQALRSYITLRTRLA